MKTTERQNNFDLLRLLAALQVVYFHGITSLGLSFGAVMGRVNDLLTFFPGVPIFFAVSGFLITRSYERASGIRSYARNRILRVYPALWASFAISIGLLAVFGAITRRFVSTASFWAWIAGQLTIVQFYNPDALRGFGVGVVNGSLWTIPVELQFYAVVPVLYWLCIRNRTERAASSFLAVLTLASFTLWFLTQSGPALRMWQKLLQVTLAPHLFMFLMGVMLQRHWKRLASLLEGRGGMWLVVYLGIRLVQRAVLDVMPAGAFFTAVSWSASLLSFAVLALLTISLAFTRRRTSERLLFGQDLSYGIYIFHMLVLNTFVHLGLRGSAGFLASAVGCTAVLAAASWVLVERPALAMKPAPEQRRTVRPIVMNSDATTTMGALCNTR